ncbi:MAG: family transporter substrate-binding protein [Anaerolineales bacterium]|nr:BMP family ABC transporter substrate-binding protein [Anaerolineales bacterium]MBM2842236.1 family transporter substrate-binding protein [Anaerolineales bacterium]
MKKSYAAFSLLLVVAFVLAACTPAAPAEGLKVGLVTDVGQLEDKSFNQSSWEGAQAGATAAGGTSEVIVTQNISDYKQNIQTFIDQGFDVIVTVGFLIGTDTAIAAKENPGVKFVGVDQFICVDETGAPDATFACAGDAATLLPNYQGIVFAEEQPGYLAGIVAASISETGVIGAVGGTNVPPVVAYNAGYVAGAQSVNPDIVTLYQETDPNPAVGFNDPAKGKAIAQQFIGEGADVLFQIAGLTGQGVLEAACDAGIYGIGVDVDQTETLPNLAGCIVTSAEKKLKDTVAAVVESAASDAFQAGTVGYTAASTPPGIGLSPYHELESLITPEIQALLDDAMAKMASGELVPPRQ